MDPARKTSGEGGRMAGELAQEGCAMTGFAYHLVELGGDIAVVIFGERDCANAFPRLQNDFAKRATWMVFTTALTEADVLAGSAERRLGDCLRAVALKVKPRAIIVLSTCLTEMIAADPVPVCREVAAATGVPIVPVATSGLKPRSQAEIADWVASVLVEAVGSKGRFDRRRVNLIGYPTRRARWSPGGDRVLYEEAIHAIGAMGRRLKAPSPPRGSFKRAFARVLCDEAGRVLGAMGLRLNAAVPAGATLDDWEALPRAGVTAVVDRAVYPRLIGLLETRGRTVVGVSSPMGVASSDAFYRAIAVAAGVDPETLAVVPERRAACEALDSARKRFGGLRLAYGLGSHHNFEAEQLAREGLGDLPLLLEMGFDIEVVIQERDRPEVHARIRRNLQGMGIDLPYRVFYEPAVLAPVLREGRFAVAYLADFLADQAVLAGVPMIALGSLPPGYEGVVEAVDTVRRALGRTMAEGAAG